MTALAGGVGGARLADGLARTLDSGSLTVIVNTGDDFDHFGLRICPDLDTVCYTLAGLENPETGWGRVDETWAVMREVEGLGGPGWFRLGDRDLATSLERTRLLGEGFTVSQITSRFCASWGLDTRIIPMSDMDAPTTVMTDVGELEFQDYFVRRRCEPRVRGFRFGGGNGIEPAPGVFEALEEADLIIICPSNPWVSVDPILSINGVRSRLESSTVIAVSPIIGGEAVKGPAAKMFRELSIDPTPLAVAAHYAPFLDGLVLDQVDESHSGPARESGLATLVTNTWMKSRSDRVSLARRTIEFGKAMTR
ncbi:MAG TPA: 2-phospho-L-lactate transferase [Anaerolineales bacterium]|nr:2-phospho-L-lactate transferase [Anaerolineales bacterium]